MAFAFQKTYSPEIEQLLRQYYQSLSEKDRRRFAALEAIQLGHGGIRYMSKVLGCDPQTVKDGVNPTFLSLGAIRRKNRQMKELSDDLLHPRSARKPCI